MKRGRFKLKTTALRLLRDVGVTLALWGYFTVGFILLFLPVYLFATGFAADRQVAFQRLNHRFYRWFFLLMGRLIPGMSLSVDPQVRSLRSCVIVCNHLSYLDPLLMIALFPRHRTFVKGIFFRVPVFGWFLRHAGYLPSGDAGNLLERTIEGIASMEKFLAAGGNVFIFPEGHRSRNGDLGVFHKGAFTIARHCHAPVMVLEIRGSQHFFQPGRFLFHATVAGEITVQLAARLPADAGSSRQIANRARGVLMGRMAVPP